MDHQAPEFVSEVGAPQRQNVEQDEGNATSTQPAVDAHEDSPEDSHEGEDIIHVMLRIVLFCKSVLRELMMKVLLNLIPKQTVLKM